MNRKLFSFLFLFLFSNCEENPVLHQQHPSEIYYPLQVGNTWYYDNIMKSDRYTPANPYMKRVIEKQIQLNRNKYYVVSETWDFSETPFIYKDTIRQENGKIIILNKGQEHIWYDFTIRDGDSYHYNPSPEYPSLTYIVKVEKTGEEKINETRYSDCIRFFFDVPQFVDEEKWVTFSPGIGIIKQFVGEGPGLLLNSYKLVDDEE